MRGWARSESGPVLYKDTASVYNLTSTANDTITLYAIWRDKAVNKYIGELNTAYFAYQSDRYTEQDWNALTKIYDDSLKALSATVVEKTMKSILAQAKSDMSAVVTCDARVKQVIDTWRAQYQTVIAQAAGGAVNETNASGIPNAAQTAAAALTSEFAASHTDLTIEADQQRVTSLALDAVNDTMNALNELSEAAAWAATLDGMSVRSLSEVTSQWQVQYDTAWQQATHYQKYLSTELSNALRTHAALSLRKQQAVSQLRMEYSSLDLEQYTTAALSQLERIFEAGLSVIEAAESETTVDHLLVKAQNDMRAVPDKNKPTKPEGRVAGGGVSGGANGGTAGGTVSGGAGGGAATGQPESNKNASKIEVSVAYDTAGKTAQAAPTAAALQKAAEAAKKAAAADGTAPIVQLVLNSGEAKNVELKLPAGALDALSADKKASFAVQSALGEVTLDASAMQAVSRQAANQPLVLSITLLDTVPVRRAAKKNHVPMFAVAISTNGKSISDLSGGSITVTIPYALAGNQRAEYMVAYAENAQGGWKKCPTSYDAKTKSVKTVLTAPARIAVECDEMLAWQSAFADIHKSDWYYDAVRYVCYHGIMNGHSTSSFRPDEVFSRAQLAQVLYNMEGKPQTDHRAFSDVLSGAWYEDAINWAVNRGILNGYSNGQIGPDDAVTREQFATILHRYAGIKGYDTSSRNDLRGFTDAGAVSAYAQTPMQWAVGAGVLSGTGAETLSPAGNALRAQAAAMLMRFSDGVAG